MGIVRRWLLRLRLAMHRCVDALVLCTVLGRKVRAADRPSSPVLRHICARSVDTVGSADDNGDGQERDEETKRHTDRHTVRLVDDSHTNHKLGTL